MSNVRKHLPSFISGLTGALVGVSLLGGAAYAANGGSFLLGRANSATITTTLTDTAGTPLSLVAKAGYAPLKVNSAIKVPNLNVDKIDNLDSTAFVRTTGTAANSTKLAGKAETAFALATGQFGQIIGTTTQVIDWNGDQVNDSVLATATCPAGTSLVSGGFVQNTTGEVIASAPLSPDTWGVASAGVTSSPMVFATCYNPRGAVPGAAAATAASSPLAKAFTLTK